MAEWLVPTRLIQIAVAAVWLYEGLWCKLLRGDPHEFEVVKAVPRWGETYGVPFLLALGAAESLLAVWVYSGWLPIICAWVQTVLLVALNASGLFWSKQSIHDPWGMVLKNFAFLILAWVAAGRLAGAGT